jgi:hypothetical protein
VFKRYEPQKVKKQDLPNLLKSSSIVEDPYH